MLGLIIALCIFSISVIYFVTKWLILNKKVSDKKHAIIVVLGDIGRLIILHFKEYKFKKQFKPIKK